MEKHRLCLTTTVVGFAPVATFAQRILFIRFHAALEATQVAVQGNAHHVKSL